jgi:peptide/nickel transport system substrate-binding protein
MQDKDVVLERNPDCWSGAPKIARVVFDVVPETITAALMIKKGSADVESNVVTLDMVHSLEQVPELKTETGPSSMVVYMNFNVTDPILRDRRVRQAIAHALDRQAIVDSIWRGQAKLAATLLPEGHWAEAGPGDIPVYGYDVARARQLLEEAGYPVKANGVRFQLTIKTSTDEQTLQEAIAMQQQLRAVGIDLQIRSTEFATFYADITKGAFQIYVLRWIGSNEDPDIFRTMYSTASFPPKGSNRGHYSNPALDALLAQAAAERDQGKRRTIYLAVQKIVAEDMPSVPLWYPRSEVVHSRRVTGLYANPSGNYDALRTAEAR